jgi:prolipoprotein diacylglyceryl transferase
MIEWNVNPEIISFGIVSIRWYSMMFMISFLLGIFIFKWIYKIERKPEKDLDELLLYMLVGTIVGARLGHCLFYDPAYYLGNPLKILKVWEGGLASHGATIGILLALYIFVRKKSGYTYLWMLDRMSITVALAGCFIRLGNLFNSEILGKPADVAWSFVFTRVDQVPRHPTQIYEALAYLSIFFFLFISYKNKKEKIEYGWLMGWFFFLIFGFRIFVEYFKENQSGFEEGMILNMGQILSVPLVIIGTFFIFRAIKNRKQLLNDASKKG